MYSQKAKEDRERKGNLFLIRSIAIVGIVIGLVLLLRGWGLAQNNNSFVNEHQSIRRNPLPINTILSVSGLSIPPVGGQSSTWAEKITTHSGLPATSGFWFLQQKNNSTILAEFTQLKVDTLLNIPQQIQSAKLFHTGQVMALNRPSASAQQLLGTNPQDSKSLVKLFEFSNNQNIVSTYLVPKYQEIYFAWSDQSANSFNISVIKPTGEVLPIYTSNTYQIREILAVDLTTLRIDFSAVIEGQSASVCYRLNMQNNSVTEIMCAAVNTDGYTDGFGLVSNDFSSGDDIYKYNYQTLNPELLWPANVSQKRELLTRSGNFLLWLSKEHDSVSIQTYNLITKAVKTHTNLPAVRPTQLWLTNGKVTILGLVAPDSYRIFIEDETATTSSSAFSSTTSLESTESSTGTSTMESVTSSISSSVNESGYTIEQRGSWKMYTLDSCAQNCEVKILQY